MIRLGLCCLFRAEPIRFRQTTAAALARLKPAARRRKLADLVRHNADALKSAVEACQRLGIGAFRVNSQILPLKTHPRFGYDVAALPEGDDLIRRFKIAGVTAWKLGVRLSFHPDQFVLLNSPRPEVAASSLAELAYHAEVADWIGADVINIHGGGGYGDRPAALRRLRAALEDLPPNIRRRLTLENDDVIFSPADLLPVCEAAGIPFCYDVHHHRCLDDGRSVEETTARAFDTWDREPLFHLSSPRDGWKGRAPRRHHDYIAPRDFPAAWRPLTLTIEVEAKAKELAVRRLARWLKRTAPPQESRAC